MQILRSVARAFTARGFSLIFSNMTACNESRVRLVLNHNCVNTTLMVSQGHDSEVVKDGMEELLNPELKLLANPN